MSGCTYELVGVSRWFCGVNSSDLAAWVQAIGSIIAIWVAIAIPYYQKKHENDRKRIEDKKFVMGVAANLEMALSFISQILEFQPQGDGKIEYDFDLQQAVNYAKLSTDELDAIRASVDKAHYFSEELCSEVIRLGIIANSYNKRIDVRALKLSDKDVEKFFKRINYQRVALARQAGVVRGMLAGYLPK